MAGGEVIGTRLMQFVEIKKLKKYNELTYETVNLLI